MDLWAFLFYQSLLWHKQEHAVKSNNTFKTNNSVSGFYCDSAAIFMSQGGGTPFSPLWLGALWQSQCVIMLWLPPVHLTFTDIIIEHIRPGAAASKVSAPLLFSYHSLQDENPRGQREHIAGGCNGLNHLCEIHQSSFWQGSLHAANEIFMKWWASLITISPREWRRWVASGASTPAASPTSPNAAHPTAGFCHRTACSLRAQGRSHLAGW